MTISNMSIEAGAKAGLISPDETTVHYLKGRKYTPDGAAFDALREQWLSFATDEGATYDKVVELHADEIEPFVTWGTNPSMGAGISNAVPSKEAYNSEVEKDADRKSTRLNSSHVSI